MPGKGHVWAYDFVACRTEDGRAVRMLTVTDEYTRECLVIRTARRIRSDDVIHTLTELFVLNGVPEHIRSDNGPEFTARVVRQWLERVGVKTLFHRARQSMGERLQRELQREAQG